MGEKERAEALLQAAGVTGVAVQPAEEMVTMSKAEADALRAAAPGAPAVGAPMAPPQIPSADAPQVPAAAREEAAEHVAAGGVTVTRADLRQMNAQEIRKLPKDVVARAMGDS